MVQEKQTPAEEKKETDSKPSDQNVKADPKSTLKNIVALLENSVSAKDTRLLMGRLMRQTAALRKDLSVELLTWFLKHYVDSSVASHSYLMQTLDKVSNVFPRPQFSTPNVLLSSPALYHGILLRFIFHLGITMQAMKHALPR
jgi:hypothetical protein